MEKDFLQKIIKETLMAETSESNAKRLDRIEEKLDKLAEAMIAMARAEEKIIALQDDHENMRERLNKLSVKLDEITNVMSPSSKAMLIAEEFKHVFEKV